MFCIVCIEVLCRFGQPNEELTGVGFFPLLFRSLLPPSAPSHALIERRCDARMVSSLTHSHTRVIAPSSRGLFEPLGNSYALF